MKDINTYLKCIFALKKQTKIAARVTHQIPLLGEIGVCWVFINIPLLPLFHHLLLSPQDLDCAHKNTENS